jgi:hypothetical protein
MTYGNVSSEYSVAIRIWKCIFPLRFGRYLPIRRDADILKNSKN